MRSLYPRLKIGFNAPHNYDPYKTKYCTKCTKSKDYSHHIFECMKYDKYNEQICTNCNAGRHDPDECKTKNGFFVKPGENKVSYNLN